MPDIHQVRYPLEMTRLMSELGWQLVFEEEPRFQPPFADEETAPFADFTDLQGGMFRFWPEVEADPFTTKDFEEFAQRVRRMHLALKRGSAS